MHIQLLKLIWNISIALKNGGAHTYSVLPPKNMEGQGHPGPPTSNAPECMYESSESISESLNRIFQSIEY